MLPLFSAQDILDEAAQLESFSEQMSLDKARRMERIFNLSSREVSRKKINLKGKNLFPNQMKMSRIKFNRER